MDLMNSIKEAFKKYFLPLFVLLNVGLLIYSNSWHVPFQFDDEYSIMKWWIRDIHQIHSIWLLNIKTRFLPYLSFAINYYFNHDHAFGYHSVNNAIHILNSFWVYFLTLYLFRAPVIKDSSVDKETRLIALIAALIFLAHPLQTQAVTYIVQRITSMVAFFYLGAMVLYLKYRLEGGRWAYVGALVLAVGSMFCKETSMTLPVVLVLLEIAFFKSVIEYKTTVWLRLIPFLMTLMIVPVLVYFWPKQVVGISWLSVQTNALPWQKYALTQLNVICTYLRLFFLPIRQNLDYQYPVAKTLFEFPTLASFFLLLVVAFAGIALLWRHAILGFAILFFFIALSVESSVIPIDDLIFEHRMYLPLVGCAVFFATFLYQIIRDKRIYRCICAAIILMLCFLTYQRNEIWRTPVTLWNDVIKKSPGKARAYYNLGLGYDMQNDSEKSKALYLKTLELDPNYIEAWMNLGIVSLADKKFTEAIEYFKKAIICRPKYAPAYDDLGLAYFRAGDNMNGLVNFQKALDLDPTYVETYYHIGMLLQGYGKFEEAIPYFEKALSLYPAHARINLDLIRSGGAKGRREEASLLRREYAQRLIQKLDEVRDDKLLRSV